MPLMDKNQITIGILACAANHERHGEAKGEKALAFSRFIDLGPLVDPDSIA
jgi:hypothetical protein